MPRTMKKYQEGGRVRAGNPGMTGRTKAESRQRNAAIVRRQDDAEETARGERMSGMRYRAPQRPTRVTKPDAFYSDEEGGDPRAMMPFEALIGPLGGPNITPRRNKKYARADQAAMDRDVRSKTGADSERAYKKGGKVSMKKYQEGGSVRSPGKRRVLEGGAKGTPVMTQEQRRQARSMMTPEERREADAPLTARELEGMSRRYKKGGVVKKAKGGMIGRGCK
jgi:hypothetical protein